MIEELKTLAKWTAKLWEIYSKWFGVKMTSADFDTLLEETKRIWEDSGEDQLILDMSAAFMNDLDRRQLDHA